MTPDTMRSDDDARRRPRIAVLGEFSSGKSTLVNVLLGHVTSPVRVTATQMPPIWYCEGDADPIVVGVDGSRTEIDPDEIASVPVAGTEYIRVPLPAEILRRFDLLDMPGSSDPNMSADIWNTLLPQADAVIWCTPATQAWRQTEAAIWDGVDPDVRARSILLVTRIDKVLSERDRERLMKRVRRETGGLFRDVLAVDLLSAKDEDYTAEASGMRAVRAALLEASAAAQGDAAGDAAPSENAGEAATVLRLEDHAPTGLRPKSSIIPRRITAGRRPRRTTGSGGSAL
ncbi:hypothetical protein P6F26_04870 [Roseibacterium sp. SDUM158017]|uniref:hypothetical protein n=1 Tax=Roseicyclus salinarum TaxID=3036773 RepID=UPI00241573B1|nr:hypothetical protein [Roseibacterium sp. SDUM158017]MDG4647765.1 hypothetical protein [Roseibacterium sp. SDUM158017]